MKTFEEAWCVGNIATVTEPKRDCQEISIGLKRGKMEFLTFLFRFTSTGAIAKKFYSTAFGAV